MLTLWLTACGANHESEIPHSAHPPNGVQPEVVTPAGTPHLSSSAIALIPGGTFGPYLGMRAQGGLALWASSEAGTRSWFARPLSASGEANGETVRLAEAPTELGLVSVRPMHDGFTLLSSHTTSDGAAIDITLLSATGHLLAGPTSVGRTTKAPLWVEAIQTAHGASILWAASGDGRAEIWTAQINQKGELTANPRLLARDVGAWQAAPFGKGMALAVTHIGKGATHGPIELSLLDGTDSPAPIVINSPISADLDLDMAAFNDRVVLAWSDHRGGENRVFSAAVDSAGKIIAAAAPATPPLGEQAVLRVVPPAEGSQRGYLAWESLDAQSLTHRNFQIAEFQPNGRVSSPRGVFEYWKMDGSMPEIVATTRGVAVLTLAPLCVRSGECAKDAPIAPEFVEFDAGFAIRSSEPLWPSNNAAPVSLAWNLTCPGEACFSLSAEGGVPSRVALTRLEHRSDVYRAPAQRVELQAPPRNVGDESLAETAPLSQIALTPTSAGTLLGWLTDFDPTTPWVKLSKPTADGRFEPLRARLDLQAFAGSEPFAPLAAAENLSLRAHSLGGIALSGSAQQKDVLAAWAGLDGGQPQVFLTLLDKAGKKLSQRMLTHKAGDLSDVALAPSGADYLVSWVDERSQDPEVYATKVNHALNRIAPEQRITQAAGAATDLSLVPTKGGALAIWADTRGSELPGAADIYSAALRGTDANRSANEICLLKSRPHSFAPSAQPYGTGALVAWLEAASDNADGEPAHVVLAVLDAAGQVVGSVQGVSVGGGTPITLGLDCVDQVCHAIVAVDEDAHSALYAITLQGGRTSNAVRVRSSNNAPSSVAPVIHGNEVYISDVAQGLGRLRRLQLEW
ncbi:MAG: hypothetical protein ABW061_01500 [Polyangiaceae bacterium]